MGTGMRTAIGFSFGVMVLSACLSRAEQPTQETEAMLPNAAPGAALRGSDIVCGTGDMDTFEVSDFNVTPATYYVLVVATGPLFGGPLAAVLDPVVEIYNRNNGTLVVFNDDNGVGSNTIYLTGREVLDGLLTVQPRDSMVLFNANFPFTIRVRGFGGSCGRYALFVL